MYHHKKNDISLRGLAHDMEYYMQCFEEMMYIFTYADNKQLWAQTENITQLINILSEHNDSEVKMMELKEYGSSKFEKQNPFNTLSEKGNPIHSLLIDEKKIKASKTKLQKQ